MTAAVPSARDLRVRLRRGRRAHRTRSLGDAFTDAYVILFAIGMYGYAAYDAGRRFVHGAPADPVARYWIAVGAGVALVGLVWQGLRAVGPLQVAPAAQSWAVSGPVDRGAWLLPGFAALLAASAAGGALLGVAFGAWAAVAGCAWGGCLAAAAVVAQAGHGGRRWPALVLLGLGGVVALAVVVAHHAGAALARPTVTVAPVLAVAGVPLVAWVSVLAYRRLGRVDRSSLSSGSQFTSAAVSATMLLDPSGFTGLVETRRWRGVGRVRSAGFARGPRWWVLLQAEGRRTVRRPSALVSWAALVLVQYAVAIALPPLAGAFHVIGAYLAAERLAGGLRAVSRSPGLRRSLGGGNALLRVVHLVLPALAAGLWWLVTVPAGDGSSRPWLAPALILGVVAAVYRGATRGPMSYGGAVAETPFGAVPVDLVRQVIRGPDLLAIVVALQVFLS